MTSFLVRYLRIEAANVIKLVSFDSDTFRPAFDITFHKQSYLIENRSTSSTTRNCELSQSFLGFNPHSELNGKGFGT